MYFAEAMKHNTAPRVIRLEHMLPECTFPGDMSTPSESSFVTDEAAGPSLADVLKVLDSEAEDTILIIRRIAKLGHCALGFIQEYFGFYGPVKKILLMPSRGRFDNRFRPSSMGFVVMERASDCAAVLIRDCHRICGVDVGTYPFVRNAKFAFNRPQVSTVMGRAAAAAANNAFATHQGYFYSRIAASAGGDYKSAPSPSDVSTATTISRLNSPMTTATGGDDSVQSRMDIEELLVAAEAAAAMAAAEDRNNNATSGQQSPADEVRYNDMTALISSMMAMLDIATFDKDFVSGETGQRKNSDVSVSSN